MELRHLRYFTAVVESKGYRNASRRLHIAQPALSQAVVDLEEELGLKLFVRRGPQIQLTPAGKVFHQEAKRTLEQADLAISAARRADKGQTGSLRIGFIPSATQHFLPQVIRSYKQQNPGIELTIQELTPAKQMEAFSKGELDLGFTREVGSVHPGFDSCFLFQVPLVAVLPRSHAVSNGQIHIRELAEERFILLGRAESPVLFDSIISLCRDADFSPRFDSHAYLAESMFLMVTAGEGVAIVPAWARRFLTEDLQLVRLLPDTVQVELVLLWKHEDTSLALRSFLGLVKTGLQDLHDRTGREFGMPQTPP